MGKSIQIYNLSFIPLNTSISINPMPDFRIYRINKNR